MATGELIRRAFRSYFGNDLFISYSRRDASHALELAARLSEKKLACYLDQWETRPGPDIPPHVLKALKGASQLAVLVSKASSASGKVGDEIRLFLPTGRPIIPIALLDAETPASDAGPFPTEWVKESSWLQLISGSSVTAVKLGAESDPLRAAESRIANALQFSSRDRRLRRSFSITVFGIFALIGLGSTFVWYARSEARKATEDREAALKRVDQANADRQAAEGLRDSAASEAASQRALVEQAYHDRKILESESRALKTTIEGRRLLSIAQTARGNAPAHVPPLLALRAAQMLRDSDSRAFLAELLNSTARRYALISTVDSMGRTFAPAKLAFTPDGMHLLGIERQSGELRLWTFENPRNQPSDRKANYGGNHWSEELPLQLPLSGRLRPPRISMRSNDCAVGQQAVGDRGAEIALAFSRNSKILVIGCGTRVYLYEVEGLKLLSVFDVYESIKRTISMNADISVAAISEDGNSVWVGTKFGAIVRIDRATRSSTLTSRSMYPGTVESLSLAQGSVFAVTQGVAFIFTLAGDTLQRVSTVTLGGAVAAANASAGSVLSYVPPGNGLSYFDVNGKIDAGEIDWEFSRLARSDTDKKRFSIGLEAPSAEMRPPLEIQRIAAGAYGENYVAIGRRRGTKFDYETGSRQVLSKEVESWGWGFGRHVFISLNKVDVPLAHRADTDTPVATAFGSVVAVYYRGNVELWSGSSWRPEAKCDAIESCHSEVCLRVAQDLTRVNLAEYALGPIGGLCDGMRPVLGGGSRVLRKWNR